MSEFYAERSDLAQVLGHFPEAAVRIQKLFQNDQEFRSLCEDYILARDCLAKFLALSSIQERPEVAEYTSVIAEPKEEITAFKSLSFLAGADGAGIVLGARVPIILTSRADLVLTRLASCAVASLVADVRRAALKSAIP